MSKTVDVSLQYINTNNRKPEDPNLPAYKNRINEILNFYSQTQNTLWDVIPKAAKRVEALSDSQWTPHSLAVEETILHFNLPLNLDESEFEINTETLEITSIADGEGTWHTS